MPASATYYRGIRRPRDYFGDSHEIRANRQAGNWHVSEILSHILSGTDNSPFISVTRSIGKARQFATNRGIIYTISGISVIDPVKIIRNWMTTVPNLSADEIEAGYSAIHYAELDSELLVLNKIPIECIIAIEETNTF